MRQLTVVVLSFNGRHLLELLLSSLRAQTLPEFQTVVVDNGSTDGTADWLAQRWPEVQIVSLPENVGVAAAINVGFNAAAGRSVALLNNDLELDERCLEELMAALRSHPDAGVVGAKLLDFHRRELLDGTGDAYSWAGLAHRRGQGEPDRGQYDGSTEVFGACGAAALYRREALEAVGPFDERFYAYCEDTDWSFRAQLAGWDARFVPTAVAYHIGSASLGPRVSEFALYQNWRNQIWVVAKNYPGWALVRHAPDLLLGQLAALYVAIRQHWLRTWLRAWRDAVGELPDVLVERRTVQRSAVRSRRELERVVEGALVRARWWLGARGRTHSVAARRSGVTGDGAGPQRTAMRR